MDQLKIEENLSTLLPSRKKQCTLLQGLLGGGGAVPPSIFAYGHTATGKSYVISLVLEKLKLNVINVNCVEYDSVPLFVAPIARKISDVYLQESDPKKCTTLMGLVEVMEKAADSSRDDPFVIVLERCERLRNLPINTVPALLKLQELSGMNVCVLMISDIIWEKFYGKAWFYLPIKIFFPQYSRDEINNILMQRRPAEIREQPYSSYVQMLTSTLFRQCRDLNELQYMVQQHLPMLIENMDKDARGLWHILAPQLRNSIHRLHLRQGIKKIKGNTENGLSPLTSTVSGLELPYYAKYLLIAAFLASYNSPKHDKRLFMKFHGKERKRLNNKHKKQQVQISSLLVGPKAFNFERLAAIFHAIAEIRYTLSTNLCAQLISLINLKLISRVGSAGLNDPKYKCAAGLDFISAVGETVQFSVSKYIIENYR